jgi:hypothetical protein
MSADTTNVCVVVHEPEIVTITMTIEQLYLMQTLMDVARQDERDEEEEIRAACADLAEAVYKEISAEIAHTEKNDA